MGKKQRIYETDITKFLKTIIWFALSLSFLVPLIYSLQAIFPFAAPRAFFFMGAVQLAFFTWVVLAIRNGNYRPKPDPVTIAVSAFIGAMALSTIFGADPFHSFWSSYERMSGLLMHLHLFAFFLVLSSIVKGKEDWIKLIGWIVPIASIVSLISLAHNFGLIQLPAYFQNGSTLANTSFMGSYLLVVAFFCLYGLIKSWDSKKTFFGINFLIIVSAIMFNSGGRAMKGAFLAGMILLFILYLAFANRNRIVNLFSRLALIVGLLASLYVGLFAFTEGHLVRDKIEGLHGMSARFLVWEMAWEGFMERPLLGLGPESFPLAFERNFDPQLRMMDGGEIWFDKAHNAVFDSLVTVGALGTILFFGMFLTALFLLWREFFKRDSEIWAPAIFTSLFVAHFIQNLTVFDMISSLMLMFAMLAFVSSSAPEREISDGRESLNSITGPAIVAGLVFLVTLNIFVIPPYRANLSASVALNSPAEVPATEYYERAFAGPIGRNSTIFSIAEKLITNQAKAGLRGKEREVVIEKMEFMIERMEEAIDREPMMFKEHWMTGRMYNEYYNYHLLQEIMYGDPAEKPDLVEEAREVTLRAKELITTALEISPRNQQGYWDLVQAEVNMGNIHIFSGEPELSNNRFKRAFSLSEEAVALEPRDIEAQKKLLQVAKEVIMDPDLVREKLDEALAIDPSWESALEAYIQ